MSESKKPHNPKVTQDHRRQWHDCLYVYPVISRRARGLSVGVNLNPDKRCNYACLYCQINRRISRELKDVDVDILGKELNRALEAAKSGQLWSESRFSQTPTELRRINDIAFSGDGEPTCLPNFDEAVATAAGAKSAAGCKDVKIVVITNASQFHCPQFEKSLPILDANNGEIWAKLDAGTDEYFQRINRPHPKITLDHIITNITDIARGRPVVIQTLWPMLAGIAPEIAEIDAYCQRLREILGGGGQIKLVQIHTVARPPSESIVANLPNDKLDAIASRVKAALPELHVETYYGSAVKPQSAAE